MSEEENVKRIGEDAVLKVWLKGEVVPYGFTEGSFSVDVKEKYIEVRTEKGEISGMFFSMFAYTVSEDEDGEDDEVNGYG